MATAVNPGKVRPENVKRSASAAAAGTESAASARIAELERENATLKQSEARLRDLIEGLRGYAIFPLDANGQVAGWNHGVGRLLGYAASDIVGRHIACLLPREEVERGRPDKALRLAAAEGRHESEGWHVCKDGSRIWSSAILTVRRDDSGKVRGYIAVIEDTSARKRLEEAERQALIGTMSAKFAHEIRNPLTSIKMNAGLIRYEIDALARDNPATVEEALTLLKSIDSELRRIQRITQDYLKFARLPKARREKLDLNEFLESRLGSMQEIFRSQSVTLRLKPDPTIPPVRIDEEQFWQALLNLVLNAVESMSAGGTLAISTRQEGLDTVLKVSDTGKGMTEAERIEIFKPFFSTKKTGTGLGLPLTQQIVTENGGRIDCESVLGKGTTFTIRFPGGSR